MALDLQRPDIAPAQRTVSQREFSYGNTTCTVILERYVFEHDTEIVRSIHHGSSHPEPDLSRRCTNVNFALFPGHACSHDLDQIDKALKPTERALRCAILGNPGPEKSYLANDYARSSFKSNKYTHVFWICVDTETNIHCGVQSLLVELGHRAQLEADSNAKTEIAKRWLEDVGRHEDQRWLLVLDNAQPESFDTLRSILPNETPFGHILLTTQFKHVARDFLKSHQNESSLLHLQSLTGAKTLANQGLALQKTRCLCTRPESTHAEFVRSIVGKLDDHQFSTATERTEAAESDPMAIEETFHKRIANLSDGSLEQELFRTLSFFDTSAISVNMLSRGIQYVGRKATDRENLSLIFKCRRPQLEKTIQTLASLNLIRVSKPGIVTVDDTTNRLNIQSMKDATLTAQYHDLACWIISSSLKSSQDSSKKEEWPEIEEAMPHIFKLSSNTDMANSHLETSLEMAAAHLLDRGRDLELQKLNERLSVMQKSATGLVHLNTTGDLAADHIK